MHDPFDYFIRFLTSFSCFNEHG